MKLKKINIKWKKIIFPGSNNTFPRSSQNIPSNKIVTIDHQFQLHLKENRRIEIIIKLIQI